MDKAVSGILTRGVADSTLATYESGKRRYLAFCSQFHLAPLPIIESTLCRFVAFLATTSPSSPTCLLSATFRLLVWDQTQHCLHLPNSTMFCGAPASTGQNEIAFQSHQKYSVAFCRCGPVSHQPSTGRCYGQLSVWDFLVSCERENLRAPLMKLFRPSCSHQRTCRLTRILRLLVCQYTFDKAKLTNLAQEPPFTWGQQAVPYALLQQYSATWHCGHHHLAPCLCTRMALPYPGRDWSIRCARP